jgi:hypothetical protein
MRWSEFAEACPEIAGLAEGRFRRDEVLLVGTLRRDGSPRISPNEVDFVAGHLALGMMWRSMKALDLLRDARCVVHSAPDSRLNPGGDVKLYGRAVTVSDPAFRAAYRDAIRARIDWAPEEPSFHCFTLDVESAAYIVFGDTRRLLTWDARRGVRQLPFPSGE